MKTVRFVTTLFICLLSLDASAVDCCSSPEERTADNLARGAPADFTTYNERICIKEPSSTAYCDAGKTERARSLGGLEKFSKPNPRDAANRKLAEGCKTQALGVSPYKEPQIDSHCQLATFLMCLKNGGIKDNEPQRKQVCNILQKFAVDIRANPNDCPTGCPKAL